MNCFVPIKRENVIETTTYLVYKCQYSALFAFLGVDRYDAATIYNLLDKVDESYYDQITLATFSNAFCKQLKEVFYVIAYHYHQCYNRINNKNDNLENENHKSKLSLQNTPTTFDVDAAHKLSLSRYYLICFLLHFLFIPDDKIVEFIFWILFKGQNKSANIVEVLLHHVDLFWTTQVDTAIFESNRKKLEDLLKGSDVDGITPYRLQMFDLRAGNVLSKMVINLKKLLIKNLGGKALWIRFSTQIENKLINVEESYNSILRFPNHFLHEDHIEAVSENEFILKAERRGARKHLRAFIRVLIHYRDMSSAETDDVQMLFTDGQSLFSRIFRYLPKLPKNRKGKNNDTTTTQEKNTLAFLQKIFNPSGTATVHVDGTGVEDDYDDQASTMSLERRYGEALDLSIRRIRKNVKEWYLEGVDAIEQIDNFLLENALSEGSKVYGSANDENSIASREQRQNRRRRGKKDNTNDDDSSIVSQSDSIMNDKDNNLVSRKNDDDQVSVLSGSQALDEDDGNESDEDENDEQNIDDEKDNVAVQPGEDNVEDDDQVREFVVDASLEDSSLAQDDEDANNDDDEDGVDEYIRNK